MIVSRVALIPVRLAVGSARVSARAGYRTAKLGVVTGAKTAVGSAKVGFAAGRAVGYRQTAAFAAGVTVGVLVASPRARAGVGRVGSALWRLGTSSRGPSDEQIAEQVARRLAGAKGTWNLPQPSISVTHGQVRLDGNAPDADGRRAIAETASEVEGVREVDNRLVVAAGSGSSPSVDGIGRTASPSRNGAAPTTSS